MMRREAPMTRNGSANFRPCHTRRIVPRPMEASAPSSKRPREARKSLPPARRPLPQSAYSRCQSPPAGPVRLCADPAAWGPSLNRSLPPPPPRGPAHRPRRCAEPSPAAGDRSSRPSPAASAVQRAFHQAIAPLSRSARGSCRTAGTSPRICPADISKIPPPRG